MKTAEDIVNEKGGKMVTVPGDTTIYDALELMIGKKLGAVLVTEAERPVGIWTSRDLMRNVVLKDFDPHTDVVRDYMSTPLLSAPHSDTPYNMMDKFLGRRINHLLIEKDGRYIGILSSGDVMKCVIQDKTEELTQLRSMVSWEYYEEWRWQPGKKR
jgi:signal-transduction protein with cAMP-binding, CBS, and nucleotidyltransferase domain